MKIPLAEHFHSIQGEGQWVGTPMHFVRLPGCSVGKPVRKANLIDPPGKLHEDVVVGDIPALPTGEYAWLCHTYSGRPFWCDTDFNKHEEVELDDLILDTWEDHICITGGEPLLHREVIDAFRMDLCELQNAWKPKRIHIETSGTIDFWWEADLPHCNTWITVSPKQGWTPYMVHHANELKLLVGRTTEDKFDPAFLEHPNVYLSPINEINYHSNLSDYSSKAALERCHELLRSHPNWKLSVQLHKYLGVR